MHFSRNTKSKPAAKMNTAGMSEAIAPAILFSCSTKRALWNHVCVCCFLISEVSESGGSPGSSVKNKHPDTEEDMEAEQLEVKRLKFSKDEEEEEDEEDEEDEQEQEVDTLRPSHATCLSKEAEAMIQEEEEKAEYSKESEASTSTATTEDQGRFCY